MPQSALCPYRINNNDNNNRPASQAADCNPSGRIGRQTRQDATLIIRLVSRPIETAVLKTFHRALETELDCAERRIEICYEMKRLE